MAKVTANGREIACKARHGTSVVFPDVCFTLPPPPAPTGATVTYTNSVFGRTMLPCTYTVYNKRKTMAVFPRARFKTSVGNEPSMTSPKKGFASNATKGMGMFVSSSFNVLFEFCPVCRDMDLVTHNHLALSPVPNTAPIVYIAGKGKCKDGKCKK